MDLCSSNSSCSRVNCGNLLSGANILHRDYGINLPRLPAHPGWEQTCQGLRRQHDFNAGKTELSDGHDMGQFIGSLQDWEFRSKNRGENLLIFPVFQTRTFPGGNSRCLFPKPIFDSVIIFHHLIKANFRWGKTCGSFRAAFLKMRLEEYKFHRIVVESNRDSVTYVLGNNDLTILKAALVACLLRAF